MKLFALLRMAKNICWACAGGKHELCTGHCDCCKSGGFR